ncbi:MAG TPA: mercury transporter MerT [Gammaproteobacteria bacterium]|nr:mercury transporter MerT [Gammaproteobacteria bacterium]
MTETTSTVNEAATGDDAPAGSPQPRARASVVGAVLAAIGASLCCIGPLVLLTLGIGGAWISYLAALEPYRPIFVGITLVFLFLAFRKLYLLPRRCAPDAACAIPRTLRNQRIIFWIVTVLLIALLTFPYYGTMFFE